MIKILHILDSLYLNGAIRSMISIAKYSHQDLFDHKVISFQIGSPAVMDLLKEAKITPVITSDLDVIMNEVKSADIVELHWWHNPRIHNLLLGEWPEMRFMTFYHMVGDTIPHIIDSKLVNFSDMNIPCNPYSYNELNVFKILPDKDRLERVAMVYDAADFSRIHDLQKKDHSEFNVGYIGTIGFQKMHPNYFLMSSTANVPNIKFSLCGHLDESFNTKVQRILHDLKSGHKFSFLGYVEDIKEILSTMDVYGYPLCENTYAAGELNLQEVMFSGIVPVVFPYGGIPSLVVNNYTGMVVRSELEYTQALEFLYHTPDERERMGKNAAEYAKQIFGAQNASIKMDQIYLKMMKTPKRNRIY